MNIFALTLLPHYPTLGVPGDFNSKCFNSTAPPSSSAGGGVGGGAAGSACTADGDCLYSSCSKNMCVLPPLQCPTSRAGIFLISYSFTLHYWRQMVLFVTGHSIHFNTLSGHCFASQVPCVPPMVLADTLIPLGTLSHHAPYWTQHARPRVYVAVISEAKIVL